MCDVCMCIPLGCAVTLCMPLGCAVTLCMPLGCSVLPFPLSSTDMIRDNFDALATRVTGWTRHDAGRFLRVASHGRRRRPRTRRDLMNAVLELSPAIIYRAIMGPFSPGATSYEVSLAV